MDQLRNALTNAIPKPSGPEEAGRPALRTDTPPARPRGPVLPDPLASDWVAAMRRLRVDVPREPTLGQLTSRSDVASRDLEGQGRKREGKELRSLKEGFVAQREKAAWALVKERFAQLDLSEKSYRALKQEGAQAEKVLEKVWGQRGEALRGVGHARVKEVLLPDR